MRVITNPSLGFSWVYSRSMAWNQRQSDNWMGITEHSRSNPCEEPTLILQSIYRVEFWSISVANQHLPKGGTKDRQVQPWERWGTAGEGKLRIRMRTGWQEGVHQRGREEGTGIQKKKSLVYQIAWKNRNINRLNRKIWDNSRGLSFHDDLEEQVILSV